MILLSKNEINETLSKNLYWEEVLQRGVDSRTLPGEILKQELATEVERLGVRTILRIIADYAKRSKNEHEPTIS